MAEAIQAVALTPEQRRLALDRALRRADEMADRLTQAILEARTALRREGIEAAGGRAVIAMDLSQALANVLRDEVERV